jgi:hypothetical protein
VAISGIARAAKDETNDEYVAGMWKRDLEAQLCWSTDVGMSPRPTPYRAPTWSWASVDGIVQCPSSSEVVGMTANQYAHILDISLTPAGTDWLGELRGGVLKLGIKFMLSGRLKGEELLVSLPGRDMAFGSPRLDTADDVEVYPLYLVPMRWRGQLFTSMLLRPTNAEKGQCSRIGIVYVHYNAKEYKEFFKALHTIGPEIARKACAEIVTEPQELFVLNVI